jgi:FKBP-type peptidyl-prolyl cis-trans isomerase FkpA
MKAENMFKTFVSVCLLVLLMPACVKSNGDDACSYNACGITAPASEIQTVEEYLATNNITATRHCSGLYYRIENAGTGKNAAVCNGISVYYKGMFTSGAVFDQSTNAPYSQSLRSLISGWKIGIPLIKEGGKIHLYVPPTLAYGKEDIKDANGNVIMPGNSMLIFEISLLNVY